MKPTTKAGLVAGLFFIHSPAFATSFGPITLFHQAENAQYYVHGRVTDNGRVALAPHLGRPYTYWDVQVMEQPLGANLGSQVTVREPGGEIAGNGYHVAATAEFSAGEEVFIALHDTDDGEVKEVVGLASGKFSVEPGKDGKPVVRSGLGLPVSGADGAPLSPDEFSGLLHRIARGQATDSDKNVFVSRNPVHDDEIPPAILKAPAAAPRRDAEPEAVSSPNLAAPAKETAANANPIAVQQTASQTEENSTGSSSWGWLIAVVALVGLVVGLFFALR